MNFECVRNEVTHSLPRFLLVYVTHTRNESRSPDKNSFLDSSNESQSNSPTKVFFGDQHRPVGQQFKECVIETDPHPWIGIIEDVKWKRLDPPHIEFGKYKKFLFLLFFTRAPLLLLLRWSSRKR